MNSQFYRQTDDGTEFGPFSRDALKDFVASGQLLENDLLRSVNSSVWVSARRIEGLFRKVDGEVSIKGDRSSYEAQIAELIANPATLSGQGSRDRLSLAGWQDQVGWEVVLAAILVIGAAVDMIWGTSESTRFPVAQGRHADVRQHYFFFDTGPWSILEYVLLWFDAVLLIGALAFGRRILSRRK